MMRMIKRLTWLSLFAFLAMAVSPERILADAEHSAVAFATERAPGEAIGSYGMVPIYGRDIRDGIYTLSVECSSPFFRVLEAVLTVKDQRMEAELHMYSKSYLFVYMGSGEAAAAAPLEDYIPFVEREGYYTFTVPVAALNVGLECAAYSKNRSKWYDRLLLFDAAGIPADALAFPLPDYKKIEKAMREYSRNHPEEETKAEEAVPVTVSAQAEAVRLDRPDGEYAIELSLTGGSGRAGVTSPTWLIVSEGRAYARLLWSSPYYDYMLVDGIRYDNETTDGGNSSFTIPITVMDEPMYVIADTTAMGDPLEIEYTLTFYSDRIGGKGSIPQEAAKRVLFIAMAIMAVGGVVNQLAKRRS